MPDRAVLAGGIHRLEDQQHGIAIGGVLQTLELAQFLHLFPEGVVIIFLRIVERFHSRRPFLQIDLFSGGDAEVLSFDFHFYALVGCS